MCSRDRKKDSLKYIVTRPFKSLERTILRKHLILCSRMTVAAWDMSVARSTLQPVQINLTKKHRLLPSSIHHLRGGGGGENMTAASERGVDGVVERIAYPPI